jgi:hypothetical protein
MSITCEICGGKDVKYKCPVCVIRYCSVGCYKTHKENGCSGKNEVKSGSFGLVKEEGELSSSDSETTNAEVDENDIDCRSLQQLGKLIYSL